MMKTQEYWEAKHPPIRQMYSGRPLPGTTRMYPIDVRHFVWATDWRLQDIAGGLRNDNVDVTAWNCQRWVVRNIKYIADSRFGVPEFWMTPGETLELGSDDCEGGSHLMASLMLHCLPKEHHWRVRCTAGWVAMETTAPDGGHDYVTFFRAADNEPVVCDWCYAEDSTVPMDKKPLLKTVTMYHDAWFSYNHVAAWGYKTLEMRGRVRRVDAGWR